MNEKKNIDRLFQEKFKDFEVAPPDFVWQNIEAELQENKKKRRILPLWFRLSGVAAILVIGMFVAGLFIDSGNSNNNPVVLDAQKINPDGSPRLKPTENPIRQSQSVETAVAEDASQAKSSSAITDDKSQNTIASPTNKKNEAVVYRVKSEDARIKNSGKLRIKGNRLNNITVPHEEAVAQGPGNKDKYNTRDNSIASPINQKQAGVKDNRIMQATAPGINKSESSVADNTTIKPVEEKENHTVTQPEHSIPKSDDNILPQGVNDNGIAAVETEVDTATTILPKNELEELYRKKLKGEIKEETAVAEAEGKNRWKIKPQMAPLFFNSASEGSPIDADLAANSKSFDNDMSYGLGVNYAITDRLSIRTGVNTVNMKYSTNDVEFSAAIDNQQPTGTNFSADGPNANLVIGSSQPSAIGGTSATELSSQKLDGSLVQKMGFVEVPLEVSYKLVDRRFGIDLIGGVSTLFLNDNNVSLISERGFRSNMGEANNLNNISFSTNVGVGFKYRIFDAFEASFEPMFKYQVNTFSNDAGNFKPYFIGLYSGISFSF